MTTLLFVGDIVGEAGLAYLEKRLPELRAEYQPDFVIANAENMEITHHPGSMGHCGLSPQGVARLFALGVDAITGGNHSWDGPHFQTVYDDSRVIRPLNYGVAAPGEGALIVEHDGRRLGIINLVSRTALGWADDPLAAFHTQRAAWKGSVDLVLVDFHGESVSEKLTFAFAVDGQASAVLGTHTHVQTYDTRILPQGTAYVTDVGMVGPGDGMQGYAPERFVEMMRFRLPGTSPFTFATGSVELGAVVVRCEGQRAIAIERVQPLTT
ncbi:MAG: YmdB family metallophosphoesterase [Anaerolineae bacterium]|nr:YmdB family metallophosphoesterase [Anaerolineae bacterium]